MTKLYNVLVTGGAGFIGSNLVETLLAHDQVGLVRVFDNMSTGFEKNLTEFATNPKFELIKGDIRNFEECKTVCNKIDLISHQAALGSVPRSVHDPLLTNEVNINGTLNIFKAAIEGNIKRVVFAASSSTYGDSQGLPKVEEKIGKPLSPYAVTKLVNEIYADVFARTYGLNYIGLRYFNVFGPKQDPQGAYAAVIPLFFKAALNNQAPVFNGDGSHSRDFTYVSNAVEANIKALFNEDANADNQIYNVACGQQTTLKELWGMIKQLTQCGVEAMNGPERKGDILHSLASIDKIKSHLQYEGRYDLFTGLEKSLEWYKYNH